MIPSHSTVHTVVECEGCVQAAQVLEPHLHPTSSAAEHWHRLGFPISCHVLG